MTRLLRFALLTATLPAVAACEGVKTSEVRQLAIINVNPSHGAIQIGTDVDISVTFSETIRAETVSGASFCLRSTAPAAGEGFCDDAIPAVASYDAASLTARLVPADLLEPSTLYTIHLARSLSSAQSGDLPAEVSTNFRTAP